MSDGNDKKVPLLEAVVEEGGVPNEVVMFTKAQEMAANLDALFGVQRNRWKCVSESVIPGDFIPAQWYRETPSGHIINLAVTNKVSGKWEVTVAYIAATTKEVDFKETYVVKFDINTPSNLIWSFLRDIALMYRVFLTD